MAQCRQRDVDTWLAKGPAGYPVRDFLDWAAEHHHCPALLVPALGRTTGAATEADTRWALIARLLHDDTLELTDRVAGAFLLCYGQQLSRIAVMTTEQVHRRYVVSLRFGAHDLTIPQPLSVLLTDLIDVGRSHHLGVGSPTTSPWLFPGHLPGRPSHPPASANASGRWASEPYPADAPPFSNSPPRSPPPSSPNSSTSPPQPPPAGPETQQATRFRYAADLASRGDHQR